MSNLRLTVSSAKSITFLENVDKSVFFQTTFLDQFWEPSDIKANKKKDELTSEPEHSPFRTEALVSKASRKHGVQLVLGNFSKILIEFFDALSQTSIIILEFAHNSSCNYLHQILRFSALFDYLKTTVSENVSIGRGKTSQKKRFFINH